MKKDKLGFTALLVISLATLAGISSMFLRTCPSALAIDLQATFGIGHRDVAMFGSATILGYGLMQMPSGLITDAIGGRKTLTIYMLLAGAATLAFAFAPNFGVGVGARFFTGLCLATVPPIGAIIAYSVPRSTYTRVLGISLGMVGLGILLSAEPLARLSEALGWRGAMMVIGFIIIAIGLSLFFIAKDAPPPSDAKPDEQPSRPTLRQLGLNMLAVLKTPAFWPLALIQLCANGAFFAFMSTWAAPYLVNVYAFEKVEASRLIFVQGFAPLLLIPFLTNLADRIDSRKTILILSNISGLLAAIMFSFFAGQLSKPLIVAALIMFNLGAGCGGILCYALIGRNFPKEMTGTGIGCVTMFWPVVAAVLGVVLGGVLENKLASAYADSEIVQLALTNPDAAVTAANVQAFGSTFMILVALWVVSLVISVFFVKERFSVKV